MRQGHSGTVLVSFPRRTEAIQWGTTQLVSKENSKRPVIIAAAWYFVEQNKTDTQKVHSVKFYFFFFIKFKNRPTKLWR